MTAGFSLIEVLVVIAIASVLAVGTTLVFGRTLTPAETAAQAFSGQADAARQAAMVTGIDHAMSARADGWQVERRGIGQSWDVISTYRLDNLSVSRTGAAEQERLVLRRDGLVQGAGFSLRSASAEVFCPATDGGSPTCAAR